MGYKGYSKAPCEKRSKIAGRTSHMAVAHTSVSPRRAVDAHGRAIPMTEAEVRARAGDIAHGLEALDDIGDDDEQRETLDALIKGLDEDRLSDGKGFRSCE
jgi:hypothetical protein